MGKDIPPGRGYGGIGICIDIGICIGGICDICGDIEGIDGKEDIGIEAITLEFVVEF